MNKLIVILSTSLFFINTFVAAQFSDDHGVPREVEELVADIKENLDAGDRLRRSKREIIVLIRLGGEISGRLEGKRISALLTDDELIEFIADWVDSVFICRMAKETIYRLLWEDILEEYSQNTNVFADRKKYFNDFFRNPELLNEFQNVNTEKLMTLILQYPLSCRQKMSYIDTEEEVANFLKIAKETKHELNEVSRELVASRYWQTPLYRQLVNTLNDGYGGYGERISGPFPRDEKDVSKLYEIANVHEIYLFTLTGFWGIIGLSNGQAKLFMMMPIEI